MSRYHSLSFLTHDDAQCEVCGDVFPVLRDGTTRTLCPSCEFDAQEQSEIDDEQIES